MKKLKRMIKNKINYLLSKNQREHFFQYVHTNHDYTIDEDKHSYILNFQDNTKTIRAPLITPLGVS
jgi:hypothetical protein